MINGWSHTPQHMTFQKTIFHIQTIFFFMCTGIYQTENAFHNVITKSMENFVSKTKANEKKKKVTTAVST